MDYPNPLVDLHYGWGTKDGGQSKATHGIEYVDNIDGFLGLRTFRVDHQRCLINEVYRTHIRILHLRPQVIHRIDVVLGQIEVRLQFLGQRNANLQGQRGFSRTSRSLDYHNVLLFLLDALGQDADEYVEGIRIHSCDALALLVVGDHVHLAVAHPLVDDNLARVLLGSGHTHQLSLNC